MPKYRKKPVVIEAEQWNGSVGDAIRVVNWVQAGGGEAKHDGDKIAIETMEGPITASAMDYVIRGVQGEHYPCKPNIFEETYEPADDHAQA